MLSMLILDSCANPTITMQLTATSQINPDIRNRALPVLIRVYQLSQADSFNNATFRQLWLNDDQILGATLIKRQEIIVNPGNATTLQIVPENNAHFIGIIALYRNPKHSQWRLIHIMPGKIAAVMSAIHITISDKMIAFSPMQQDK